MPFGGFRSSRCDYIFLSLSSSKLAHSLGQYIRDLLHAAANIRMRQDSKSGNPAKTLPLQKNQPTGGRPATTSEARAPAGDSVPSKTVTVPHLDLAKRASLPERPLKARPTPFPTRVPLSKTLPLASIDASTVAAARTRHCSEISPVQSPEVPPAPPPSAEPTPERERSVPQTASSRPRRTATLLPTLKPRPPPSLLFSTPPRPLPSNQEIEEEMNQFDTEMQETDDELMGVTKWVDETLSNGSLPRGSMSSTSSVADTSPTLAASSSRRIRRLRKEEDPTPPRCSPRLHNIPPTTLPLPGRRPKRRVFTLASYTLTTDEEDNIELPPPETLVGQRAFVAVSIFWSTTPALLTWHLFLDGDQHQRRGIFSREKDGGQRFGKIFLVIVAPSLISFPPSVKLNASVYASDGQGKIDTV